MLQPPIFISGNVTKASLEVTPTQGKHHLEPFKTAARGTAINLLEDHHVEDNNVEVHRHEADLWICLQGEATFVVGGRLVEPWARRLPDGTEDMRELRAPTKGINGGMEYMLHAGDLLWIPAGQPHVHTTVETARLYIIKVPQPEVPLADVPGWNR